MSDIALTWDEARGHGDFTVAANDLVPEDGLRSAVIVSLYCEAPAQAGDVLPDGTVARGGEGGWWGDAVPSVPGDRFGSRLWLLRRSTRSASVLSRAQTYALEALQWLKTDQVASAVAVAASYNAKGWLVLDVTIDRPAQRSTFRFDPLWVTEASR